MSIQAMPNFMISKFVGEDIHTLHILQGKTYILLAEFAIKEKAQVIERLKNKYPELMEKLKGYQGGEL